MVKFRDSQHVVSLTFLSLAILALDYALEEPSIGRIYIAAIAAASVVTTNWLEGFGLAMAVVSYLIGSDRRPQSPKEVSLIHSCHGRLSLPWGRPLDSTFDHNPRNVQRSVCRRRI